MDFLGTSNNKANSGVIGRWSRKLLINKGLLIGLTLLMLAMLPINNAATIDAFNGPDATGDQQLIAYAPVDLPVSAFDLVSADLQVNHDTKVMQGTITVGDKLYTSSNVWYEFQWRLQVFKDNEVWDYTISIMVHGADGASQVTQAIIVITTPTADMVLPINDTSISENTVSFSVSIPSMVLYSPDYGSWYFYYHILAHDGVSWDAPDKFTSLDEGETWNNNTQTSGTSPPDADTSYSKGSEPTTEADSTQSITGSGIIYAAVGLIIVVIAFALLFSRR